MHSRGERSFLAIDTRYLLTHSSLATFLQVISASHFTAMATIKKVATIKASMSKKVASVDSLSDTEVESVKDMLQQLGSLDVTLDVLTKTLIGTVVSKFKNHPHLGPPAKALVKKWKKVVKEEGATTASSSAVSDSKTASSSPGVAVVERRNSTNSAIQEMQDEWASLQPYRNTTCNKL